MKIRANRKRKRGNLILGEEKRGYYEEIEEGTNKKIHWRRKKSKILICGFTGKKMNFVLFCFDFESDGENIAPGWVIAGARFWSNPKSKFNWSVPLVCSLWKDPNI